jgi:hypothetical protein
MVYEMPLRDEVVELLGTGQPHPAAEVGANVQCSEKNGKSRRGP